MSAVGGELRRLLAHGICLMAETRYTALKTQNTLSESRVWHTRCVVPVPILIIDTRGLWNGIFRRRALQPDCAGAER